MEQQGFSLKITEKINPIDLAKKLVGLGYEKVGISTPAKEGQFSVRGGLLDLWLERYKMPVRLDLIGEQVENVYLFNPLTQAKIKNLSQVYIVPFGVTPKLAPKWTKKVQFPSRGGQYERLFLSEVQPGDLVVHIDHGVGKFLGVVGGRSVGIRNVRDQTRLPPERAPSPRQKRGSGTPRKVVASDRLTFPDTLPPYQEEPLAHKVVAEREAIYKLDRPADKQVLAIEYAKGGKLYVPIEQIERVTKYIGAAGFRPRLNSLGSGSWERVKAKVEESIVRIAQNLLNLYARRELVKRPAYLKDTAWQKQMEDSFEFEETNDQSKVTSEIKRDLEGTKPMDRILVGDVGFGKTEVAIRAAFKVVQESHQVAVLVPTTLLAQQHYHLFKDRLKEFPVEIEILSRFRNKEEQNTTLGNLASGKVDIVLGTHRLLSADVDFKNLGLLIIDEEHRFGVVHKEKLKKIRASVDVLSMSATPIPRTLHMALSKLRNISVLKEAPVGRKPVQTFVGEDDLEKAKMAIETEIARGGQIYYLYNNVAGVAKKTVDINTLVPKARVVFAHGRMAEQDLEKTMGQFYSGQADILVCTTIIGSGLDMPNVNTILIEDAQNFGLAELHQLRGRVGRSDKQAYSYLFYPKGYLPVGNVLERLLAISGSTQLGAGFDIAKKDLKIRGAGNLLGKRQSGNIALVGYELYIQLLSQQIEKLK
ncbi:MAG: DEAD/DEAH box helicase [Candidatus Woykebacteria bacterium]